MRDREGAVVGQFLTHHEHSFRKPINLFISGNYSGSSAYRLREFRERGRDDGILTMGWSSGIAQLFPYHVDQLSGTRTKKQEDL